MTLAYRRRYDDEPHPAVVAKAGDWGIFTVDVPPAVSAGRTSTLETVNRGRAIYAYYKSPELWGFGKLHPTAGTAAQEAQVERLPGLERLERAAKAFPEGELNDAAYTEAVKLLDIIGAAGINNLPVPDVGVGEDEISLSWSRDDHIVLMSVEGDGEAAYTYYVGDRFLPGREVFMLEGKGLPNDLREYLSSMYA